jgi:hypothetical protein
LSENCQKFVTLLLGELVVGVKCDTVWSRHIRDSYTVHLARYPNAIEII